MPKAHVVVQRKGDTWARVVGDPTPGSAMSLPDADGCPECGSKSLVMMEVRVENALLIGGKGVGSYVKCTGGGCNWESEIMARAE